LLYADPHGSIIISGVNYCSGTTVHMCNHDSAEQAKLVGLWICYIIVFVMQRMSWILSGCSQLIGCSASTVGSKEFLSGWASGVVLQYRLVKRCRVHWCLCTCMLGV